MNGLNALRTLLGIGCRRVRNALGLGDRRKTRTDIPDRRLPADLASERAREELRRLADIRFKGPKAPSNEMPLLEDWEGSWTE